MSKKDGISVAVARFREPVWSYGSSVNGEPENALFDGMGHRPSRQATMTYTQDGLVCEQEHGTIIVPLANVAFVKLS